MDFTELLTSYTLERLISESLRVAPRSWEFKASR